MEAISSKAKRLGYVLERYSEDEYSVRKLAHVLNYFPSDLEKDMKAVISYILELETSAKEVGE